MIQFNNIFNNTKPTMDNVLTEDGNPMHGDDIRRRGMQEYYQSRLSDFEAKLSAKCKEEDIRLLIQDHPQAGRIYIVGPQVFNISVNENEISWSRIQ